MSTEICDTRDVLFVYTRSSVEKESRETVEFNICGKLTLNTESALQKTPN